MVAFPEFSIYTWAVLASLVALAAFVAFCHSFLPKNVEWNRPQLSLVPTLVRAFCASIIKRRSTAALARSGGKVPNDITLLVPVYRMCPTALAGYKMVCCITHGEATTIPPLYPQIEAASMMMYIVTHPSFPLSVLGAVHARNVVKVYHELSWRDLIEIKVWIGDSRVRKRGIEVDIHTQVKHLASDTLAWESINTSLFFCRTNRDQIAPVTLPEVPDDGVVDGTSEWFVDNHIGRNYARVCGDWNPIHVSDMAARLFGFRRSIAHGMWVTAKCLDSILQLDTAPTVPYEISVAFKKPLHLGSTATYESVNEGSAFRVKTDEGEHVVGTVTSLS